MSITYWLPGAPRQCQLDVCDKIEQAWAGGTGANCIVVSMPTGAGKSHVANAIAQWAATEGDQRAIICPPNGELQRQYQTEFRNVPSLWSGYDYRCLTYRQACSVTRSKKKAPCKSCPHEAAVQLASQAGVALMNPYTLMAYRRKKALKHPDVLIIDEAHKIVDFQMEQTQPVKLWRHQHPWPMEVSTAADVVAWIDNCERNDPSPIRRRAKNFILGVQGEVAIIKRHLPYRNREEWCLEIKPLSARWATPVLWPPRNVKLLVLLSATINRKHIDELGLDRLYRVAYVESDSPIPHACRPVVVRPVVSMSHANGDECARLQAEEITRLMAAHPGNGIVHATYEYAQRLRPFLTSPRMLWHDQGTKSTTLQDFYGQAGAGRVLVASGMREGVDLKGDRANWQVVTKVPYPNLGEALVAAKAEADTEWYDAMAVQELLQAVGRVCRSPTDYGATYVLDAQFGRLFADREYLFPNWFRDALRWPKEIG